MSVGLNNLFSKSLLQQGASGQTPQFGGVSAGASNPFAQRSGGENAGGGQVDVTGNLSNPAAPTSLGIGRKLDISA